MRHLRLSALLILLPARYASDGVVVERARVLAPGWAPNTDGVDPDSCSNVLIKDCVFRCD